MFAPSNNAAPEQLAAAANAALRAETHNTGEATVPAGAASVTIRDPRFGGGRYVVLIPLDATAAGLAWHQEAMRRGEVDIAFVTAPASPARFAYATVGVGTPQGGYNGPVIQNG